MSASMNPDVLSNAAIAMYRSPAASTDGYTYVVELPVWDGIVRSIGFENVWPRSRETEKWIFELLPSKTAQAAYTLSRYGLVATRLTATHCLSWKPPAAKLDWLFESSRYLPPFATVQLFPRSSL